MVLVSAEGRSQGVRALQHYQEASTSAPCSRLHFSSLRNTSEIPVSLKPADVLTAVPPALQPGEWLHWHCAGLGGEQWGMWGQSQVLLSLPGWGSPVGCDPAWGGSSQLVLCASKTPPATLVLFCTPLSHSHPEGMMSWGKMCSFK